jgi:hypothetical protein
VAWCEVRGGDQGLSLTVRSVRVLRDHLLANDDWDAAGCAYVAAQDRDYGVIHRATEWAGQILYERGPEAMPGALEPCR